jgi:hypothetical protein
MCILNGRSVCLLYGGQVRACGVEGLIDNRPEWSIVFSTTEAETEPTVGMTQNVEMTTWGTCMKQRLVVLEGENCTGLQGLDWMHENDVIIDVAADCIHIGNDMLPFVDP